MKKHLLALVIAVGVPAALSSLTFAAKDAVATAANLGKTIPNFTLKDTAGRDVALASFQDKKAVVVIFIGTECPINNAYMPRLMELQRAYGDRSVQFVAINSNQQDDAQRVAQHAKENEISFPVLKDWGNTVSDLFAADRTPEAFVLDGQRAIRYRGRIDDQFGVGYKRARPNRKDLEVALEEVLAGKKVSLALTQVAGCFIARAPKSKAQSNITFTKDVARIVQKNCQECHRKGQIGPMSLMTYKNVAAWAESIREAVSERRMPPWFADEHYGKYRNDRSLSEQERTTLLAWIEQGCPKGDDRDMPPPREFDPGWRIGTPDVVFTMKEADAYEVPAVGPKRGIEYKYFEVETGFTEDKWAQSAEARAGAPSVVHHIIVFIVPPKEKFVPGRGNGALLCGTAPGDMPMILQPGNAKRIPAGAKLVFQLHYTANGKAAKDRSSVAIMFAKEPPKREVRTVGVLNTNIQIPPGADNYERTKTFPINRENTHVLGFMPHMHLRGKDVKCEIIYADGKKETILWIPKYNFNWQSAYRLETPLDLPKGSKVHWTAHFDNSAKNPNNPDPTKEVRWGDQTWEEMMIGWTDMAWDIQPAVNGTK
jgi:peroxiredoxin